MFESDIEKFVIELLRKEGFNHLSPEAMAEEREQLDEVVLIGRLRKAVEDLNHDANEAVREREIKEVLELNKPGVADNNEDFYRMLIEGISVEVAEDGHIRGKVVHLIDFENITRVIGEFRNGYGFFSHGQDLQSEKFDRYLVELTISSSDLLASFLIVSHAEDLKDRNRVYYEENDEFNRYIDETSEEYPVVRGIQLSPSRALFSDIEAYKEELLVFINEKTDLIERLEKSENFVSTRSICSDMIPLQDYLTEMELKRVVRAGIDNPQIYRILGHGYTRNLFTWIFEEKDEMLTPQEITDLQTAFARKLY